MVRRHVLASLCVLGLGALAAGPGVPEASANGRPPATSTINFRAGMEDHILAGMTFGAVLSEDGGQTWHWVCEDAIGYGGMYDPDYAYAADGSVFATTFDGLKVNRDGCVWEASTLAPAPPATRFISTVTLGPDGAIFAAASEPQGQDSNVYRSTDGGLTWPVVAMPAMPLDWWDSIEVAPSDPQRVYLAGYRFQSGQPKEFLLRRSDDAGQSWSVMPTTGIVTHPNSIISIVGISRTDADTVFIRVTLEDNAITDAIYRSTDAGLTWTRLLAKMRGPADLAFLVRRNGDLVVGSELEGAAVSRDNGATWTELVDPPRIGCLYENSAGEVWACTQNYGIPQVPPDGFGIMKSADLVTWTGVLRYQEIDGPLACPAGTVQREGCDVPPDPRAGWCGLCAQLGCDPQRECPDVFPPDAGVPDAGTMPPADPKGCCDTGAGGPPASLLVLGAGLGWLVLRRRRPARA